MTAKTRASSAAWPSQWRGDVSRRPLVAQKQTSIGGCVCPLSALAAVSQSLFDYLVSAQQERLGDSQANALSGPEVDHKFELRRLYYRQFGCLFPL